MPRRRYCWGGGADFFYELNHKNLSHKLSSMELFCWQGMVSNHTCMKDVQRCHSSFIYRNSYFFNIRLNLKKKYHRSIHNIRLQMIIDIQVFEFSNTCTVGARMAVVRLTSMEALISCQWRCTSIPADRRQAAVCSSRPYLPASACGPTAVSGCRPTVIVPGLAHRRPPMSHMLNFTPYIASYIFLYYRPVVYVL